MKYLLNIRTKSLFISMFAIEIIIGSLLATAPEIFFTKVMTSNDLFILAILFLIGSIFSLLTLEQRDGNKNLLFLFSLPIIAPFIFYAYKTLISGLITSVGASLVLIFSVIISLSTPLLPKQNKTSRSLLAITVGLVSVITGLTFLIPLQYNHPLLVSIKSLLPLLAVIFLITGSLTLKASEKDTKINNLLAIIFSLPLMFLGVHFASKQAFLMASIYVLLSLSLASRFLIKFFIKDQESEEISHNHQLLNSYNKILEWIALGSLLIFIVSTFSPMFAIDNKTPTVLLIVIFAAATVFWFHILPHNLLSKKQLFLWLNLYTLFIVTISITQTSSLLNPFFLLYSIPIFITSSFFGKKEIIYPTWIALIGILLSLVFGQTLVVTSIRFIAILTISYLAQKTTNYP